MKRSHQIMFERCFERLYQKYTLECGMAPEAAREMAADDAWMQYEAYCDDKLEERKTNDETIERLGLELNAIAGALGIGSKRSQ